MQTEIMMRLDNIIIQLTDIRVFTFRITLVLKELGQGSVHGVAIVAVDDKVPIAGGASAGGVVIVVFGVDRRGGQQ